ncbi:glycosyltransferase family 2 protein [Lachnospiraceae bacterium ZAX-1]
MKKLIIIPAYNEQGNIERTIKDIKQYAKSFDYVIINDCSTDATLQICRKNKFNIVNLPVNMGIGGAVQTGYLYAYRMGYDIAVQFDGDGQHDAKYLEPMAKRLEEQELDMLIGSRFIEKEGFQSSGMRRIGIKYFTGLIKIITKKRITDPTSGMRMVNRNVIELFSIDYPKDYPEPESVTAILKMKKRVEELPVIMRERAEGISSISAHKSIYYMVKVTLAIGIAAIRKQKA